MHIPAFGTTKESDRFDDSLHWEMMEESSTDTVVRQKDDNVRTVEQLSMGQI